MKARRLARSIAMQLLYQWEIQGLIPKKTHDIPQFINHIDWHGFLDHFLYNFYPKDKSNIDIAYVIHISRGSISALVTIDRLLDTASNKWKLNRMDAIDRSILRISCFELLENKLPPKIIINEAIEIAKRFGGEQSAAFINGLLDNISHKGE